jgi:F-type H+-transporting ATPase subunit delta
MLLDRIYADALASYGAEKGITGVLLDEFAGFMAIYESNGIFREFLNNAAVSVEKKLSIVKKVLKDRFRGDFVSFIEIIVSKQRQSILPDVYDEFRKLTNKSGGVLQIEIRTAFHLPDEQVERIRWKFGEMYGNPNTYAHVTDAPSLIGGFEVRIGDTVYDYSVSGRISQMAGKLMKSEEQDEYKT